MGKKDQKAQEEEKKEDKKEKEYKKNFDVLYIVVDFPYEKVFLFFYNFLKKGGNYIIR